MIRIVQLGLGPIGTLTARAALLRPGVELVGAVDTNPALVGRDVGAVLSLRRRLGIAVQADLAGVLRRSRADLVLHCTVSRLADAAPQILPALARGVDVVSSTEELSYPWVRQPELARRIDRAARRGGATVHGTGVNPGFSMDVLALVASAPALEVRRLRVVRRVDATRRRRPLRDKVGAGMAPADFRRLARGGRIGHVGLVESMQMLAAGLGFRLDRMTHRLQPVIATRGMAGPPRVRPGDVAGQREILRGYAGRRELLRFELVIAMGARPEVDEVRVEGTPPLTLRMDGGVAGDPATAAALLNAVPRVAAAPPGLLTGLDLPVPRWAGASPAP